MDYARLAEGTLACSENEKVDLNQLFEPQHDKTNKMTCAPSEDTDQPGQPHSLIRVFAVCMKKHLILGYP